MPSNVFGGIPFTLREGEHAENIHTSEIFSSD